MSGDSEMSDLPLLLKIEQVAYQLQVSRTKAYVMVASGEIESVLVGEANRRVPREALFAYIENLRAKAKDGGTR